MLLVILKQQSPANSLKQNFISMSKKNYATLAPFFVCPCSIVTLQVPKADSQKNGDTNYFPYKSHPASQPQTPHLKNSICGYITF